MPLGSTQTYALLIKLYERFMADFGAKLKEKKKGTKVYQSFAETIKSVIVFHFL